MKEKAMDRARMAFRIRTKMVKNVKANFKNMFRNNLKCEKWRKRHRSTLFSALARSKRWGI